MQFVHAADLHLSASAPDKDYSLAVLNEIGQIAIRGKASLILFAGDTFDSFTDALALRKNFSDWAAGLGAGVRVFLVPGNHEDIEKGANDLSRLDFGPGVHLFLEKPFCLTKLDDTEFLMVPFQKDFYDSAKWQVPPKAAHSRVVVMHGTVAGLVFVGAENQEGETAAIDPDLFGKLDADYAALGHIHGSRSATLGKTLVAYPGSARVWRQGEVGPRTVLLVDTSKVFSAKPVTLKTAGEFREVIIHLQLDGTNPDAAKLGEDWSPADSILLVMRGIVENENTVTQTEASIRAMALGRVRIMSFLREVSPVAGIADQPTARRFLDALETRQAKPEEDLKVLERARELGLQAIAIRMGAKL